MAALVGKMYVSLGRAPRAKAIIFKGTIKVRREEGEAEGRGGEGET